MNADRVLSVGVALLCVLALGVTATTLQSSLSSKPGDVVNPLYDGLPFDQHDVSAVRQAFHANEGSDQSSAAKASADGPTSQQTGQTRQQQAGGGQQNDGHSSGGGSDRQQRQQSAASGGSAIQDPSLLDRLLALLRSLWPLLALLAAAGVAYRYRDRLLALLAAAYGSVAPESLDVGRAEPEPWDDLDPENEVEHAWVTMVRALGIARPWTKTPGECAQAAVAAGMDREAVEAITRAYEAVRYGDEPVTERHVRQARRGLRRLDGRGPTA